MAGNPQLLGLLEEMLESGKTPEEVCRDCPHLLPEVRQRWQDFRRIDAQVGALLPGIRTVPHAGAVTPAPPTAGLPQVPGYEMEAVLGRGGMGVVYKARHLALKRTVAIKMLAGGHGHPAERARFQAEAEAVARLQHPNIVQIHEIGEVGGLQFFALEFVAGGSLATRLAGQPLPPRDAARLVAALAEAMHLAHSRNLVHRDLKPGNVLLVGEADTPVGQCQPKVTDFGLVRQLDADSGQTEVGMVIGTPSYMAPEQAEGRAHAAGPAADVYALGAILYECLTGRPPFQEATPLETLEQVRSREPVAPSVRNRQVPRDLDTICLKCLRKEPERRYSSARELADDLGRFVRGEPVAARPTGWLKRTAKWVRRNPTLTAVLVAGLLLMMIMGSWGLWFAVQRAHRQDAVAMDLGELTGLQANARWTEARAVLERAEARLEGGGPTDLHRQLGRARQDLDLAMQLDAIRMKRATRGELDFYKAQADREYAATFRKAGLGTSHDPPALVATRIAGSPVSGALVAALYDWSVCAAHQAQRGWLLQVARQVDAIPGEWHERVLDPTVWEDRHALMQLTEVAPVASEPVSLLLALGERLRMTGGNAVPFLRRVQQEHPADFWANLAMGNALLPDAPRQAVGALRAALASRPDAAVGYCAVGDCFRLQQELDVAVAYYAKALRLDPTYARTYNNLGLVLQARGRMDEAIDYHQKAVQLDPDYAWSHHDLGNALRAIGRLDEAYVHFQEALQRDPQNPVVLNSARSLLMRQGRGQEVQAEWRKALEANPPGHEAWFGYAELCLYLQQTEEYRRATRALLDRFGETNDAFIAERVGRACLLLPGSEDEVKKASALTERAVAILQSTPPRLYPYSRFALGLAQYRLGHWASAIPIMRFEASEVMGPCPRLVVAMAQHRDGQPQTACRTLAAAVLAYDWRAAQADNRDAWICHILRREAEGMILPNLPAFLDGQYQPEDNDERLALLGACQFTNRTRAMARLYADAFAAAPSLADDLGAGHRYNAARAAALAGCGRGADATGLGEEERVRWREQARQWLRADLAARARAIDPGPRATAETNRIALTRWQNEPDLAVLREPGELDKLAADERKECLALWADVAAVLARIEK